MAIGYEGYRLLEDEILRLHEVILKLQEKNAALADSYRAYLIYKGDTAEEAANFVHLVCATAGNRVEDDFDV